VEQTFITLGGREGSLAPQFRAAGALVLQCPLSPVQTFVPRLWRLIRSMRPDVVVSHVCLTSGAILLVARMARVPVRVARMNSERDGKSNARARRTWRALMRWMLRHAATDVLGITAAALRFADPPPGDTRYRVLYNGVDLARVNGWTRTAARQRWHLPGDAPVLAHIGRAHPVKNRPFLVDVHNAARRIQPDTRLLAAGPGGIADLTSVHSRIVGDPLIVLTGETEEIASVLAAVDVLLLPSHWEGLGSVVLEALAAGVPVLANDLPCLREVSRQVTGLTLLPVDQGPHRWAQKALELARPDAVTRQEIIRRLRSSPFLLHHAVQEWRTVWRADPR
jgi:glycosyltransferase involved in cell wall biosynthesis